MDRRRIVIAAVLDLACLVLFVALGRRSHDEGSAIGGTIEVAAPFVLAAVVGWFGLRAWRRPFAVWETGLPLWLITVAGGMILRHFVFDRGTALPFIIVATAMTGLLLLGWRGLWQWRIGTAPSSAH